MGDLTMGEAVLPAHPNRVAHCDGRAFRQIGQRRARRTPLAIVCMLLAALAVGCTTNRPHGPDPSARLYLFDNEMKLVSLHEAELPLRVGVENIGDQPFPFTGEVVVRSDGSVVGRVPFGKLAAAGTTGASTIDTITVHQVCTPGHVRVFAATVEYDPSITAPADQVDVDGSDNGMSTGDVCPAIYGRYLEAFREDVLNKVNSLRGLEKLPPLQAASVPHESCANADAKSNFQSGDPHGSSCGSAQNTCDAKYGSFASVLGTCIEQQMYYKEKQNYESHGANPVSCFNAPWPETCGHYVTMTDKDNKGYKELAVGVFVTVSEVPYVVLDFFT